MNQWIVKMHSHKEIQKMISPGIFLVFGKQIKVKVMNSVQNKAIGA